MNMKDGYMFHAGVSEKYEPEDVWLKIWSAATSFSKKIGVKYHVSSAAAKISVTVPPEKIAEVLSYPGASSFLVSWDNCETGDSHFFSYFKKHKVISCDFSAGVVACAIDQFGASLFDSFSLSNMVVQKKTYLGKLRQFQNPGRNNLYLAPCFNNGRDGYIEGVSAEMWFGDSFWEHAKCTKADVLGQERLHCEERPTHLYVRAWPEPFSSAEDEQGAIQRRLLDLLFGINEKTPPPLPPPAQGTIVQKVLVDGDKVRDLGMEEVRPDGTRQWIKPPESQP